MPPKIKVTREDIVDAAVLLVRQSGAQAVNARSVAAIIGCSTQPVFSNFASMEELRLAVAQKADLLCEEYMRHEAEGGEFPDYKAHGIAYIRFAREERELFKLLYMRDRAGETVPERTELGDRMESIVSRNTGLCEDAARLFHLEMWAFVHGIATMLATGFLELEWNLISRMLTDAYQGLRKKFERE